MAQSISKQKMLGQEGSCLGRFESGKNCTPQGDGDTSCKDGGTCDQGELIFGCTDRGGCAQEELKSAGGEESGCTQGE